MVSTVSTVCEYLWCVAVTVCGVWGGHVLVCGEHVEWCCGVYGREDLWGGVARVVLWWLWCVIEYLWCVLWG